MNLNKIPRGLILNLAKAHFTKIQCYPPIALNKLTNKQQVQFISTYETRIQKEDNIIKKILKKIPFLGLNKSKLLASGYLLYETVADRINYIEFFEEFDLPDTFYSWFVVTELHLWMLSVRSMAEDEEGRFLRNALLQALWSDVAQRVKKIGVHNPSATREQVFELSEQLQAALIAYDEGLQSSDAVLAGALWRRLYQQTDDIDMRYLDKMINYIRKHIRKLDNTAREDLFDKRSFIWEPCK